MRNTIFLLCVAGGFTAQSQRVLHFTATSGFDHGTRDVSFAMFQSIGLDLGITVDDAPNSSAFNDPGTLSLYDAIVFSNTSGNDLLNEVQRTNFEEWMTNGGNVMGIHAASDTYRHSTANGNNTGTWDYYAELVGASVQENPNHVSGTPPYEMMHIGTHPSTADIPDPWLKNEEYYYWEGGYFNPSNNVVLQVEETIGPNGQVNSYDAPRPMSWYRELPSGSRIFYTALGHAQENYTDDDLFREHVKDALGWLLAGTVGLPSRAAPRSTAFPNPASDMITVVLDRSVQRRPVIIVDALGRTVRRDEVAGKSLELDIRSLANGSYLLIMEGHPPLPLHVQH